MSDQRFSTSIPLFMLLVMFAFGCNRHDAWKVETYPGKGTVRINGEIPVHAMVTLHYANNAPDKRESTPWGLVEEDGTYHLSTYKHKDGAPAGEYRVTLKWPQSTKGPSNDRLRGKFLNVEQPVMTVVITSGLNELPPIDLKNVKVMPVKTVTDNLP